MQPDTPYNTVIKLIVFDTCPLGTNFRAQTSKQKAQSGTPNTQRTRRLGKKRFRRDISIGGIARACFHTPPCVKEKNSSELPPLHNEKNQLRNSSIAKKKKQASKFLSGRGASKPLGCSIRYSILVLVCTLFSRKHTQWCQRNAGVVLADTTAVRRRHT